MSKKREEEPYPQERIYLVGLVPGSNGSKSYLEHWDDLRQASKALRRHIPEELLEAYCKGRYRQRVLWSDAEGGRQLEFKLLPLPDTKLPLLAAVRQHVQSMNRHPPQPTTAGELLAQLLRRQLEELSTAESSRSMAPVRRDGRLSRAHISEVALDLLSDCRDFDYAPGEHLVELVRELLKQDRRNLLSRRRGLEWYQALQIDAQRTLKARELARALGVSHTTIQSWRGDESYSTERDRFRQFIEKNKSEGAWPPPLKRLSRNVWRG